MPDPRDARRGARPGQLAQDTLGVVEHRRPVKALAAALICLAGLVVTGVIALIVPVGVAHDAATLNGFTRLSGRPRLGELAGVLAHSVDPSRYVVYVAVLAAVALIRGRRRLALAVPVAMVGASATTELLKPLVGHVHTRSG